MTTAVASAPAVASLAAPQHDSPSTATTRSSLNAPSTNGAIMTPSKQARPSSRSSPSSNDNSAQKQQPSQPGSEAKNSPSSSKSNSTPQIFVKKEPPSSPEIPASRHRPRRLDLSTNKSNGPGALSARPSGSMTAKDGTLAMHDVGLACLSPGFHTQDPTMRSQLQRSIDVRDRQRQIIEARQKSAKDIPDGPDSRSDANAIRSGPKSPLTSRRKGPPPGLSIAPPSHERFANERTIQSAPLNQSFTGLRQSLHPPPRHVGSQLANHAASHIQHVPANQTSNRLPPISDVFAPETLGPSRPATSRPIETRSPGNSNPHGPLPSPGLPPPPHTSQPPTSNRRREYKSAEDAVQILSGGREDLLPRLVHYGGHQPPTPPSPAPVGPKSAAAAAGHPMPLDPSRSGMPRRRTREEYEQDTGSPPLGRQPERRGPFGEPRDSPETQRAKKEEFIQLCARAWDLFHS